MDNKVENYFVYSIILIFVLLFIFGKEITSFALNMSTLQKLGFYGLSTFISLRAIIDFKIFSKPKFSKDGDGLIYIINAIISLLGDLTIRGFILLGLIYSFILYFKHGNILLNGPKSINNSFFEFFKEKTSVLSYVYFLYLTIMVTYVSNYIIKTVKDFSKIESSEKRISLLVSVIAIVISMVALLK